MEKSNKKLKDEKEEKQEQPNQNNNDSNLDDKDEKTTTTLPNSENKDKNNSTAKHDKDDLHSELMPNQESITNANAETDIRYVNESTIQAKTSLTVEAVTNIKGHLIQNDQKLIDEQASQYLQYLTDNVPKYTTTFGISELPTETILPYYRIIDYTSGDLELPSFFSFETFTNSYYETDMTSYESKRYSEIFKDHPVLLKSTETFPVNAYKVSIKWSGQTFSPNISDPTLVGATSLIKNVAYIGTYSSDNYRDRKLFSRFKTFLEIAANCNLILKGCRTKPLSIEYENTAIAKKLAGAKVLYNDKPHILYNGIYHVVAPFCKVVNDMLKDGAQELNFNEVFKFGREIITKINTYDMLNKGFGNIDQFTAYLLNLGLNRIRENRLTASKYKVLTAANFPSRVSLHVFDTMLDELLYVYDPTDEDWKFSLFVIMIDKDIRSMIMTKALDLIKSRNLFGVNEVGVKLTTLINNRNPSKMSKDAANYIINVLAGGSVEVFCKLITADMYARFIDLKVESSFIETEYLDLLKFFEIILAFIITPRLAWWNSHIFGRHLFDLMFIFCRDELNSWEAEFGYLVKSTRAGFVKYDKPVCSYDKNDLLDGVYFSFLVNRTYSQPQVAKYPFISSIYSLITPMGDYINLDRKVKAKYPFFEKAVRGYLPCSIIDYREISMVNPVNNRVNAIGTAIDKLSQKYFTSKSTKTSTKESYNLLMDVVQIAANNLGVLMHSTVAPMLATLYDSFLFFCDGFDKNSPWIVPRMLSYSGYDVFAKRNETGKNKAEYLISGRGIVIPLIPLQSHSMLYTYVGIGIHGVCRTDTVTISGSFLTKDSYDPNTINIMPFNGNEITDLALKIVGHSKRINSVFTIFNYLHRKSDDEILSTIRDRLSKFWSTSNARAVLSEMTKIFNCPIERYFEQVNAFDTMHSDPRVYKPTLYCTDFFGNIDPLQPDSIKVRQEYQFGDSYFTKMLKVISHITFDDELPLFRQVEGLAFGFYSITSNTPTDYFDVENDTVYFSIDLDVTPEVFTTTGTNGFSIQLKFKRNDVDYEFTNPFDEKIPRIKFLINRLGNINEHFVIFMSKMIESKRHIVILRKLIVDYNIITLSNWKDFVPTSENLFDNFVRNRDIITINLNFYDTRFIIQNRTDELLNQYLVLSYRNITPLRDFVVMGGIFGNPNQAIDKLTKIDKDVYCFGEESNDTSKYLISRKEKIKGSVVNFNNHFQYLGDKAEARLPILNIRTSDQL
jgi:hypothetical protein